jgi:hypothetical protein
VDTTITVRTKITATVTPTKVAAAHTANSRAFGDGRYLVGSEIQPGLYHTDDDSNVCTDTGCSCTYARLSNLSGNPHTVVVLGPTTIEVEPTDQALQVSGGCAWTKIG